MTTEIEIQPDEPNTVQRTWYAVTWDVPDRVLPDGRAFRTYEEAARCRAQMNARDLRTRRTSQDGFLCRARIVRTGVSLL